MNVCDFECEGGRYCVWYILHSALGIERSSRVRLLHSPNLSYILLKMSRESNESTPRFSQS
jgi:hypothetical protein